MPMKRYDLMSGVDARGACLCTQACLSVCRRLPDPDQPSSNTGHFYIDDELLAAHGITDLEKYSVTPGTKDFIPDFFVD